MKRLLMIIDPQIDFISGTLPVPGALEAMDALARYVRSSGDGYSHIVVTADRHPIDHISFIGSGGQWPRHCVQDSVGAAVWPVLMDALCDCRVKTTVLHKGEEPDREEYSIFSNPVAKKRILQIVKTNMIDRIDICGIAGDVCVASTIADGISIQELPPFYILMRFTPSLDGGEAIRKLTINYDIQCDR